MAVKKTAYGEEEGGESNDIKAAYRSGVAASGNDAVVAHKHQLSGIGV